MSIHYSKREALELSRNLAIVALDPSVKGEIIQTGHNKVGKRRHVTLLGEKPERKTKKKGREAGPNTQAVCDICDEHGDIKFREALPYLYEKGESVFRYFTENTDGKKQGVNRYNAIKNVWKTLKRKPARP